jgi:transcriptional regulator with XRE-family HTH domain
MTENERLRYLRKDILNLTFQKFAERIGYTAGAISDVEHGRNTLSPQLCRAICHEYGVREEWLRDGSGPPMQDLDREAELFEAVGRLLADQPESFRRRVVKMVLSLTPEEWEAVEKKMREVFEIE